MLVRCSPSPREALACGRLPGDGSAMLPSGHPDAQANGGIADRGIGNPMEREVPATLDGEGKQERESDSERRVYPEERPRGARGE